MSMKSAEEWRDDAKNWPGLSGWIMAIQADALRGAVDMFYKDTRPDVFAIDFILAEADRIEKGNPAE